MREERPIEDTVNGAAASPEAQSSGISFRRRLLVTLGTTLALVFLTLGTLAWFATYGWLNYQAQTQLKREAEEIASNIVTPRGFLRVQRYAWHEPHHRFSEARIDPYFAQIFDAQGTLLHASDNIQTLAPGTYPQRLLSTEATPPSLFESLKTFRVGEVLLYYDVHPLRRTDGPMLGYVQVARYEPGISGVLRRVTLLLLVGLGGLLAGLLLLIQRIARRVLRPLESITRATEEISPRHLHRRVPLPTEADRETTQLAATLNTLLTRLEHSFAEMQRFTANAAHELQTPLTVLRGHVDVALRRPRSVEAYQETLRLLGSEIDHMTRMVRGLLVLARLDRDHYVLDGSCVNLTPLVQEAAVPFNATATAKHLTFDVHAPDEAWILGQPDLLREVVSNVLDNAVKYTPLGSVTVRLETKDRRVSLTVADTGVGIPPEALPHVTDRFYRAASVKTRDIPGSGLGLSLVARIAALHQGQLQLRSTPGEGTTVRLTFPEPRPPLQPARPEASSALR